MLFHDSEELIINKEGFILSERKVYGALGAIKCS